MLSAWLHKTIFSLLRDIKRQTDNNSGVTECSRLLSDEYWIHVKWFSSSDLLPYLWGQLLQHVVRVMWHDMMMCCPPVHGCSPSRPNLHHRSPGPMLSFSYELTDIPPWLIHHPIPLHQLEKLEHINYRPVWDVLVWHTWIRQGYQNIFNLACV